jgi:hypothetical protein
MMRTTFPAPAACLIGLHTLSIYMHHRLHKCRLNHFFKVSFVLIPHDREREESSLCQLSFEWFCLFPAYTADTLCTVQRDIITPSGRMAYSSEHVDLRRNAKSDCIFLFEQGRFLELVN